MVRYQFKESGNLRTIIILRQYVEEERFHSLFFFFYVNIGIQNYELICTEELGNFG